MRETQFFPNEQRLEARWVPAFSVLPIVLPTSFVLHQCSGGFLLIRRQPHTHQISNDSFFPPLFTIREYPYCFEKLFCILFKTSLRAGRGMGVLINHTQIALILNTVAIYVQSRTGTFRRDSQRALPLMKLSPASNLIKIES